MTDTERYQIIGRVVSEHEAAKKHLATLNAQGKQIGEFVSAMGAALSGEAHCRADATSFTVRRHSGAATTLTGEWPSVDVVTQLLQDIAATKARVVQLDAQRKDLGV